jgi:hypothetical protein
VHRIATPGPNRSREVARSSASLVREYIRRLAEWAELSEQLTGLDPRDTIKVDLTDLLLPELVLAPDQVAGLEGHRVHGMLAGPVPANFVRREAAAGHAALADSGLWEPYEPLVRLFERGGELFTHHGFIHVEHSASFFPRELKEYARLSPLLDLHDRALDRLDRCGVPADASLRAEDDPAPRVG